VLGCALLSPNECVGECIEKLKDGGQEVFYDLRHQTIYEMLATMFNERMPIDVITVQQRLKDKQLLEQVGGICLSGATSGCRAERGESFLLSRHRPGKIPAAENDCHLHGRRRAGFMITKARWTRLMDEVERDILRISESRAQSSVLSTKELVGKAIGTIENYFSRKGVLNGLATGFADLDRITDGFARE